MNKILFSLLSFVHATEEKTEQIIEIIKENILDEDIDKCAAGYPCKKEEVTGYKELGNKIKKIINSKKMIHFVMVGFPFKSFYGKDCVIGESPDMAEYQSFLNIQKFLSKINMIYPCKITIYTDGHAFAGELKISYQQVFDYEKKLKKLVKDFNLIEIVTMHDLNPTTDSKKYDSIIKKFLSQVKIEDDEKNNEMWLKHLSIELGFPADPVVNKNLTLKSMAFSKYIQQYFPKNAIKTSVHFSNDVSKKIGFRLIHGHLTPWHGVAVKEGSEFFVMHKKNVKNKLLKTQTINGVECPFYQ